MLVSDYYQLECEVKRLKKIVEKCKRLHSQTFIQDMMTLKEEVNYLNQRLEKINDQLIVWFDDKGGMPQYWKRILNSQEKK